MIGNLLPLIVPLLSGGLFFLLPLLLPRLGPRLGLGLGKRLGLGQNGKKESKEAASAAFSLLSDALLIGFLAWKITPLVIHFSWFIRNPLSLLFAPGGWWGLGAGVILGITYLIIRLMRRKSHLQTLLCGAALAGALLGAGGYSMVRELVTFAPPEKSPAAGSAGAVPGRDQLAQWLPGKEGEVLVLNFWASWCGPCKGEIPELLAFQQKLKEEPQYLPGVRFVTINLTGTEKSPGHVEQFIRENGITFPVIYDRDGNLSGRFSIQSLPTTILLDHNGREAGRHQGSITLGGIRKMVNDHGRRTIE